MSTKEQAVLALLASLIAGAIFQRIASKEAAMLGLSVFGLTLIGLAVGQLVKRVA